MLNIGIQTATCILSGVKAIHMMKKKQIYQGAKSAQNRKTFIDKRFDIVPYSVS